MQLILDIDLDFFVHPLLTECAESTTRPDSSCYKADTSETILRYLKDRCYVDRPKLFPGRFFEFHRDLYFEWKRLIAEGKLNPPFEVVHIDGHADLGMGDSSAMYLLTPRCKSSAPAPKCRKSPRRSWPNWAAWPRRRPDGRAAA
jgi:hypothetical protein